MQIDTSHTSPNQTPGRQGVRVDRIVWHHTGGGSVAAAISWVTRPESQVSYHYLVDEAGRIFRVVPEQNTSWHAGTWAMNLRSIGICHPVDGGGAPTRDSSVALARDICRRFGIPADGGHIIPHRAVVATACPGALPVAQWIALVAGGGEEPAPVGGDDMRFFQRARRPDGGEDIYVLLDNGQIVQTVQAGPPGQGSQALGVGQLPGSFSALVDVGYWQGMAYVRGIGRDGALWQVSFRPGAAGWEGPTRVV
ncbi:MAG: N-acetylmuramoyl-L-alanine amidase [Candidatus Dormibacteraeota bacterium]|nr:N-acetylmuramoyl-L-alanine amidase [Candidatus Dormibacteraeota bacterium]